MLLDLLCFVFYLIASAIVVAGMFDKKGPNKTYAAFFVAVALVLHAFILQAGVLLAPGQNMSLLNVASLIGWLVSLSMLLTSFKLPNTILLPVIYVFSGLIVILNSQLPGAHMMDLSIKPSLLVHIALSLLAYASLAIAFLYTLQLSYINLRLKEKKASLLHSSLPPLMAVEDILFKLLWIGTILLTLSLATGFMFLDDMFAKEQAHKTLLSLLAWVIYSIIVIGHWIYGWRGRIMIFSNILAAVLLTLGYFGSRFVREVILNS
ncbi:inner membrane protein YpjD [Paraglaciecola sp. 2405UD69-4]|uniref:cytochrome C assembly family protein n=1 Tax=Paraglaciecola sp. 2405UD69-4 TaxID=3391836 RepID=UPI0039C97C34